MYSPHNTLCFLFLLSFFLSIKSFNCFVCSLHQVLGLVLNFLKQQEKMTEVWMASKWVLFWLSQLYIKWQYTSHTELAKHWSNCLLYSVFHMWTVIWTVYQRRKCGNRWNCINSGCQRCQWRWFVDTKVLQKHIEWRSG